MYSPHDPLLTPDEAGDLLGTGPDFPRRLAEEGRLDHVHDGDDLRIPQSALINYAINAGTQDGASAEDANSATDHTIRAA